MKQEFTREEILHLAKLSGFNLSEDQIESLKPQLSQILEYISHLQKIDTSGVKPTFQVFDHCNEFDTDQVADKSVDRDTLLSLSADVKEFQVKVPKVL